MYRCFSLRFGRLFANSLKRRRPKLGDKWSMDEMFMRISGKTHSLWRAVDQHGHVLDILVQSRRNAKAARRFFRKLLRGLHYVPRVVVTDKLRSYPAAKRDVLPGVHRMAHAAWPKSSITSSRARIRLATMSWFSASATAWSIVRYSAAACAMSRSVSSSSMPPSIVRSSSEAPSVRQSSALGTSP